MISGWERLFHFLFSLGGSDTFTFHVYKKKMSFQEGPWRLFKLSNVGEQDCPKSTGVHLVNSKWERTKGSLSWLTWGGVIGILESPETGFECWCGYVFHTWQVHGGRQSWYPLVDMVECREPIHVFNWSQNAPVPAAILCYISVPQGLYLNKFWASFWNFQFSKGNHAYIILNENSGFSKFWPHLNTTSYLLTGRDSSGVTIFLDTS